LAPDRCIGGKRSKEVEMSRSSIRAAFVGLVAATALAGPWVLPVGAGGGMCHAELTEGSGTVVAMSKLCFRPGVIRVDPGTRVTFVNRDPTGHNVSASGWGNLEPMSHGDAFSATFAAPGVYPFACLIHPGMVGAVVVGEDLQAGSGDGVSVSAGAPGGTTSDTSGEEASLPAGQTGALIVGGLIGASLLAAVGLGFLRRRLARV
jgi:plastocyanin